MTTTLLRRPDDAAPEPAGLGSPTEGHGSPPSRSPRRRGGIAPVLALAELATAGLTVATVAGMSRLFTDWSFAPPVLATAVIGHAAAIALRRLGWRPGTSLVALSALGAVVLSWLLLPETLAYGLPTGATLDAAGQELAAAWDVFGSVVAPTPVEPGFVLALAAATWMVAVVADTAFFRLGAPIEGAVPAMTLFGFASALGAPRGRLALTAAFLTAVLAYMLAHRALRQVRAVAADGVGTPPSVGHLLARAAPLGAVAVVAALVVGPALPGAEDEAVIPWRASERDADSGRVTISPMVQIRDRLVSQSNVEVFTVRSSERAYWRLTSLEIFDGDIWSSRGSYRRADGALPEAVPRDATTRLAEQEFEISGLASPWLPAAYRPAAVDVATAEARYDPESGSLLSENDTSDGLRYRVQSAVPLVDPGQLAGSEPVAPAQVARTYTQLPEGFPPRVAELARAVVGGAATPYEQALALQGFFRNNFEYSLDIGPGHGTNAIEQFLFETRLGYCEQFSGTYAAMARAIGLPARVAVGFTPGEQDSDGVYHVSGLNAHAWPEVYIDGQGWVAFEPTPGRGIPGAEAYTGVPEAQASPGDPTTATTLVPWPATNPAPAAQPGELPDLATGDLGGDGGGTDVAGEASPWPRRLVVAAAGLVAATIAWGSAVVTAGRVRRRRRRAAVASAADRVHVAWQEVRETLARVGVAARPWETNEEYARRAGQALGEDERRLRRLAVTATAAQYGPSDVPAGVAEEAVAAAAAVEHAVRERAGWRERLRWALDPRPLLPRGTRARLAVRQLGATPAR